MKSLFLLLALCAGCAHAGMGWTALPGTAGDGPVTVFYPTAAANVAVQRGPFALWLAPDAPPADGKRRLIVISHGSGGAPWVFADLSRALVEAGFVVALPRHHGDNHLDNSTPGPPSWRLRPSEIARAIDVMGHHAAWKTRLQLDKVGIYGTSAGGHAALTLAGGWWSDANFLRHCEQHLEQDFSSCVGFVTRLRGDLWDPLKKAVALGVLRQRFQDPTWHSHHDPRVAAVVAAVPFAADFDMNSLATPRVPLGLATADGDINQIPIFHAQAVLAACGTCEHVVHLREAGHGAFLSPLPPFKPDSVEAELLSDPPGFDRHSLTQAHQAIAHFFLRHLQSDNP
jgi:predicted dienelactone hydrolase